MRVAKRTKQAVAMADHELVVPRTAKRQAEPVSTRPAGSRANAIVVAEGVDALEYATVLLAPTSSTKRTGHVLIAVRLCAAFALARDELSVLPLLQLQLTVFVTVIGPRIKANM